MLKSLEFLKHLQDSIEYLTRIDYVPRETREEVINSLINEYLNDDYMINKIKQDLEVLNILDYRAVNIELFKEIMYDYKNNDKKALYVYNFCEHEYRKLTMEEFLKIKKFLLTNYEERVKELVGDNQ